MAVVLVGTAAPIAALTGAGAQEVPIISVGITAPADDGVVEPTFDLQGTASIGDVETTKDTSLAYVLDRSGSTTASADVNCDNVAGPDTILTCEKEAVRHVNAKAQDTGSPIANSGVGVFDSVGGVWDFTSSSYVGIGAGGDFLVPPGPAVDAAAAGVVAEGGTVFEQGRLAANQVLSDPDVQTKRTVVFLSDGISGGGALGGAVNGVVHAFAIGGQLCTSGSPSLAAVVAAGEPGGSCTEVVDLSALDVVVQQAVASQLISLELSVDGGDATPIDNADIDPDLPQNGMATVDFSTQVGPLAAGPHTVCVTARGTTSSGDVDAADCVDVQVEEPIEFEDLGVQITPGTQTAGRDVTPLSSIDPSGLRAFRDSLQSAPLRFSPLRFSPLRFSPLRFSPLRFSPLRFSPLRFSPLRFSPLSAIPLRFSSWEEVLQGTRYEDVPLQTILLDQVLALPDADAVLAGVMLGDIDLGATPLRDVTIAAVMLAGVPVERLVIPANGWPAGTVISEDSLLDIEVAGHDLSAYYAESIPLRGVSLETDDGRAPLADIHLVDVNLAATPFGAVPASDAAGILPCGPAGCPATPLGEADAALLGDATLGALLGLLGTLNAPTAVSLGEVLAGIIPPEDFPVEEIGLDALLARSPVRRTDPVTLEVSLDLNCAAVDDVGVSIAPGGFTAALAAADPAPAGTDPRESRYIDGTAFVEGVAVDDPQITDGDLSFAAGVLAPACSGDLGPGLIDDVTFTVQLEPPVDLGSEEVEVVVEGARTSDSAIASYESAGATGDDSPATATPIERDVVYTGHISQPGDEDFFTIPAPSPGTQLTVTLSHLDADFDVVVYGPGEGPVSAPLRFSPLRFSPLRFSAVEDDRLELTQDAGAPPETLQDVPLRFSPVRGTSTNRGTASESATIVARAGDAGNPDDDDFTIQITGYNGASSGEPYVLRVKQTPGPEPADCAARPIGTGGVAGAYPSSIPVHTSTLILVNRDRLGDLYGGDPAALMTTLQTLAARDDDGDGHPDGVILPVESHPTAGVAGAYSAWDADPCAVDKANEVTRRILQVVDDASEGLDNLKHVVLVGGDDVIPQARVADLVSEGNQSWYASEVRFRGEDNPISRAFAEGYLLTDDPYGDVDPQPWLGGELFTPELAIGRLVEDPAEIKAAVDQYLQHDGRLDPESTFVAGYDFLTDGATEVFDALSPNLPGSVTSRLDETWTAQDALDGIESSTGGYTSVNAHYDHYRSLPAQSFNLGNEADLLDTGMLPPSLLRSLLFTMGCQAGLNVPDVFVSGPTAEESARLLDWAQATGQAGGLLTGNTGFGYGDTDVVAYSERLMSYHAQNLKAGTMSAGQALMFAKQQYLGELAVAGVYDAKVIEESTFYGLPMYRIGQSGSTAPAALPEELGSEPSEVTVVVEDFSETPSTAKIEDGDRGDYWVVDEVGEPAELPQVTHYRPVQPRTDIDVTGPPGLRAHGVLLEDLESHDEESPNPNFSRPIYDLALQQPELPSGGVIFPSSLTMLNSVATSQGRKDQLVLVPGQFRGNGGPDEGGIQRLFTLVAGEVIHSDSVDFESPFLSLVQAPALGSTVNFRVTTPATDVVRGVILYREEGDSEWRKVELTNAGGGLWSATVGLHGSATKVSEFIAQLQDGAGNVGVATDKAVLYDSQQVIGGVLPLSAATSPQLQPSGWYQASPLVTAFGPDTISYTVNGGPPTAYTGPFDPALPEGDHVITFTADDGQVFVLPIRIDGTGPVVTVTRPTATVGVGAVVTAEVACTDALSGVASCPTGQTLDTTPGTHTFSVTATDNAGNSTTETVVYRAAYTFAGFFSPVDNLPTVNSAKAGSSIPVKFQLKTSSSAVVGSTASVASITSRKIACATGVPLDTIETLATSTTPGGLVFLASEERFQFTWKTVKGWAGTCRQLDVKLADDSTHSAQFKFK